MTASGNNAANGCGTLGRLCHLPCVAGPRLVSYGSSMHCPPTGFSSITQRIMGPVASEPLPTPSGIKGPPWPAA